MSRTAKAATAPAAVKPAAGTCDAHGVQAVRWIEGAWRCQVCGEPCGPVYWDAADAALARIDHVARRAGDAQRDWEGKVVLSLDEARALAARARRVDRGGAIVDAARRFLAAAEEKDEAGDAFWDAIRRA